MRDLFRPCLGRWKIAPSIAVAIGWSVALASLAASSAGVLPAMFSRGATARESSWSLAARFSRVHASPAMSAISRRADTAADTMARAEAFLFAERERLGVHAEGEAAGDRSGLLGGEVTPLMTTLGSLEAKRLSTNPEWARVLTLRLGSAGIGRGDLVAAGFSGSFPGLNLALIAACQALGADLFAVSSVTASTWGANQPGFTWPEMEARLVRAAIIKRVSVAITAGGDADMALDLDGDGRAVAYAIRDASAQRLGIPGLQARDFGEAVGKRLAAYRRAGNGRPIALYVNVGGADASLGRSTAILRLRSGFLPPMPFGRRDEQGVTARLAGDGVPILVLLNVRDLALRWGVPLSGQSRRRQPG
jgi:poly-gamma-glutamate system protein